MLGNKQKFHATFTTETHTLRKDAVPAFGHAMLEGTYIFFNLCETGLDGKRKEGGVRNQQFEEKRNH